MAPRSCWKSVAAPSDKPKVEKRLSVRADMGSAKRQEPLRVHYNNQQFICMINEYRKQLPCQPLLFAGPAINNRITVCVRVRPLNETEISKNQFSVVTVAKRDVIILPQPQMKVDRSKFLENQIFRFDYVFDEHSSNDLVYQYTAKPLTRTVFEKGFATGRVQANRNRGAIQGIHSRLDNGWAEDAVISQTPGKTRYFPPDVVYQTGAMGEQKCEMALDISTVF
ncbi:Kinesin-like protein KIF2A [Trichinella zimbabwensis]|uniref:Kinesin-like protein KIF2A n=1 Tax=Trichinella zimbabwensis TaxID=268475 RepID=A0A0V1GVP2_9BILA|nr:Kinesin-like protein KIF2A [Trichinella zimbabwensis]